jgi:hypothetical protein
MSLDDVRKSVQHFPDFFEEGVWRLGSRDAGRFVAACLLLLGLLPFPNHTIDDSVLEKEKGRNVSLINVFCCL